jgi:thymidine phosphorylase
MLAAEIIRAKRDGGVLSEAAIRFFVAGLADGRVVDAQAAAFAMAVCLRGMTPTETVALTLAMRDSGQVLDWRALGEDRPVLDKHSTGGVGDKVSLILAPLLAACGAAVPMISGRGLGHTGGTLDKLDAIPGYRSQPDLPTFCRVVRETGCAIAGATAELAPTDARLYAIRDVTATVESLALITASILSKKLAEGAQALVMDVKVGSGAFMATEAAALELAESLVRVGTGAGLRAVALLTDMDQVLGRAVGNALEVREALDVLRGGAGDPRLLAVTFALAAEALVAGGLCADRAAAHALARRRLADGSAAERFGRFVAALGGPGDLLERPDWYLAQAPCIRPVPPARSGFLARMDAREIGLAVVRLGGGRTRPGDSVDFSVGLAAVADIGEAVGADHPLCLVHARTDAAADEAAAAVRAAVTLADVPPPAAPPVRGRFDPAPLPADG